MQGNGNQKTGGTSKNTSKGAGQAPGKKKKKVYRAKKSGTRFEVIENDGLKSKQAKAPIAWKTDDPKELKRYERQQKKEAKKEAGKEARNGKVTHSGKEEKHGKETSLEIKAKNENKKQSAERRIHLPRHTAVFLIVLAVLALLIGGAYYYVTANYTITNVYVEGSSHYTSEEIIAMVMGDKLSNNSLFLSMKYQNKSIDDVPFVEKMDVSVIDAHTVKIEVYEKALAGYVEYLDRYLYFDKDGILVESSQEKTEGIPMVTGLSFDHAVLHQPLSVENDEVFTEILNITQLVNKYELSVDRIYFGADNSLILYFDNVKAALGSGDHLEEKVMELQYILPNLDGMSGTIRMESYTEETKTITFEPDN